MPPVPGPVPPVPEPVPPEPLLPPAPTLVPPVPVVSFELSLEHPSNPNAALKMIEPASAKRRMCFS
jgi:hypothetical protein